MRSWKPEVTTVNDPNWYANALRFATHTEAEDYVLDLAMRWTAVTDTRVVECEDPVNYEWIAGYGAKAIIPHDTFSVVDGQHRRTAAMREADKVDGYDRDDLGESPDY